LGAERDTSIDLYEANDSELDECLLWLVESHRMGEPSGSGLAVRQSQAEVKMTDCSVFSCEAGGGLLLGAFDGSRICVSELCSTVDRVVLAGNGIGIAIDLSSRLGDGIVQAVVMIVGFMAAGAFMLLLGQFEKVCLSSRDRFDQSQ
jgi:hypothetical protein